MPWTSAGLASMSAPASCRARRAYAGTWGVAVIVEEGQRAGRAGAGAKIGSRLSSCTLTHSEYRFYSLAMPRDDFLAASDLDLRSLEARVNDLIRTCNTLKAENNSLRSRQDQLVAERAALIEKTEMARNRVEAMIQRLKSLETGA